MSNLFFTSDHHFGHRNIIRFTDRPFESVEEMDAVLIERWNERVKPGDIVYHLGDFSLCSREETEAILDQLQGSIRLIRGNHEGAAMSCRNRFEWIKDYCELKMEASKPGGRRQLVVLCHYAMRVWRSRHHGSYHLYGHSHGSLPDLPDQHCFDVGVDCHDFYPISWEEVKATMATKEWVPPFANEDR